MELNAINIAKATLTEKLKKRETQLRENEGHVKKQQDEIRKISKLIKPKEAKALFKAYSQTNPTDKVKYLAEAFVGLLLYQTNVTFEEVQATLAKEIGISSMMNKADPLKVNAAVADKHFDTITSITKSFMDSSKENEHYKKCVPHTAILAWCSQYIILVRHMAAEKKVQDSYDTVQKEITQKDNKVLQLQAILDGIKKDGSIDHLQKEVATDLARI